MKRWLVPGTMPMLMLSVAAGAISLYGGPTLLVLGRAWVTAVMLVYWGLSLPAVAHALLTRSAHRFGTIRTAAESRGARILVVVGNGSVHYTDGVHGVDYLTRRSVFCAFEAARVFALVRPEFVVTTGGAPDAPNAAAEGNLLRELLIRCGIPADRIRAETQARTTAQQVANVLAILGAAGGGGPLIAVTTPAHMPRVAALFQDAGAQVVPSMTLELHYGDEISGWRRWRPSMAALTGSTSAMYELLARARTTFGVPESQP